MTLLSAYKATGAGTPMKSGRISWIKDVIEPHLPRGWHKFICMKNGQRYPNLVQYRDSDGSKYKSLKDVEDYLSKIIMRNNWQNHTFAWLKMGFVIPTIN